MSLLIWFELNNGKKIFSSRFLIFQTIFTPIHVSLGSLLGMNLATTFSMVFFSIGDFFHSLPWVGGKNPLQFSLKLFEQHWYFIWWLPHCQILCCRNEIQHPHQLLNGLTSDLWHVSRWLHFDTLFFHGCIILNINICTIPLASMSKLTTIWTTF